ncbi:MAG: porin, partial [Alphaproteobacteria bacterium]|nr:porin [Alphaproteobacteria bacterium]
YFYIPGTETCLKISGSVRFAYDWSSNDTSSDGDFQTRARVEFTTANDSEIGTIGSYIRLQGTSDDENAIVEQAYITVGGFRAGYSVTFADDIGIAGENDAFISGSKFDMVSYTYSSDAFTVGLGVDELTNDGFDDLGVEAMASASLGAATVAIYGGYDIDAEEGFIVGQLSADVGPGSLGIYGGWASDPSAYVDTYEWTVGAAYTFKATDKLSITPSVNYFEEFTGADYFGAGVLATYQIASGLSTEVTVDYKDTATEDWSGFVRLIRSF